MEIQSVMETMTVEVFWDFREHSTWLCFQFGNHLIYHIPRYKMTTETLLSKCYSDQDLRGLSMDSAKYFLVLKVMLGRERALPAHRPTLAS